MPGTFDGDCLVHRQSEALVTRCALSMGRGSDTEAHKGESEEAMPV
jgi:hypothetical protein